MQLVAFQRFPDRLRDVAMSSVGALSKRSALRPLLDAAADGELAALASELGLTAPSADAAGAAAEEEGGGQLLPRELVTELLLAAHTGGDALLSDFLSLPLFPTVRGRARARVCASGASRAPPGGCRRRCSGMPRPCPQAASAPTPCTRCRN